MSLKNVVIINDFAHVEGGASQVALSSAIGLAGRNISVKLLTGVSPIDPELKRHGVEVYCCDQRAILEDPNRTRAVLQGIWNFKAAHILKKILDCCDPASTIVHLHSWTKALSSSVVRMTLKRKYKLLCTLHDYFTVCPNGTLYRFHSQQTCDFRPLSRACIANNCDKRRNYLHKLYRLARHTVQCIMGRVPRGIEHFVFVSDFSKNILRSYLPDQCQCFLVANPIEIEHSEPVDVARNDACVVIGRLSEEKGILPFLDKMQGKASKVILVGDGECRNKISRTYPFVEIAGWVDRTSLNQYLDRARVLVFPSLWYETQGLAVLEAAARGVPALVSDACAARDFVINHVTGIHFRGGDFDDLALKLDLMKNDMFVRALGQSAYTHYWEHPCTRDRHTSELIAVYSAVLQGSSTSCGGN